MSSTHKRVLLAIVAAAVIGTTVAGCGRGTIAKVEGRKITRQEYYSRLERLNVPSPQQNGARMEAGALVLQQMIGEELIRSLAEKEKVSPTEAQVNDRVRQVKKNQEFVSNMKASGITDEQLKEMLRVEQAVFNLQTKGVKVSNDKVKKFYGDNKSTMFTIPEQADVAVILAKDKAVADKAMRFLKDGMDFKVVAGQLSSDPNAASTGGRLGRPVLRGDQGFSPEIQNKILSTPIGKYTQPISAGEGRFVIFQVLAHRKPRVQPFTKVEFAIREQLMLQAGAKKNPDLQKKLTDLRKKADIDISIERYEKLLLPKEEKESKKK